MSQRRGAVSWPLGLLGAALALYLLAPLAFLLATAVAPGTGAGFADPVAGDALRTSVQAATWATAIITALGVPLGYALARGRFRGRAALGAALMVPLVFPPVVSGILLLSLFGPYGAIGGWFATHGWELDSSFTGVVLAQIFVAAPFVVIATRSAFAAVDPALGDVAATLGASQLRTFWRIDLPQAWGGVAAGITLAWLRALGEYGATVVLAYHPYTLPIYTFVRLSGDGGVAATYPLALMVLGVSVLALALAAGLSALARRVTLPGARATTATPLASIAVAPGAGATLRATVQARLGAFALQAEILAPPGVTVILGPSGAGKSVLLRCLAGLTVPTTGTVRLGDAILFQAGERDVAPARRGIGYVPQGYALFTHLTVAANVGFGLARLPSVVRQARVAGLLAALRLGELAARSAGALSGGQAQRVALARALAPQPQAMLLDEPFAAIDPPLRRELRLALRDLWRVWDIPILLVTHDLADARSLADHLILLDGGRVLRAGARDDVLRAPGSARAAELLGLRNCFPAHDLPAELRAAASLPHGAVSLRPERLRLAGDPGPGRHAVTLLGAEPADGVTFTRVRLGDAPLDVVATETLAAAPGARLWLTIPPDAIIALDDQPSRH